MTANVPMGMGHVGEARQAGASVGELMRGAETRAAHVVRKLREAQLNTTGSKKKTNADSEAEKDPDNENHVTLDRSSQHRGSLRTLVPSWTQLGSASYLRAQES